MAQGEGFSDALATATGSDLATVESAWGARWSDPAILLKAFTNVELWFAAGGVLVVIGAWRARKRTRRTLSRWEQQERREDEWMRMMQAPPGSSYVN